MIVADVNLIAYLLIDGPFTEAAKGALRRDPHWLAPVLWRHELLNILATSVRENRLTESQAMVVLANAPHFVQDEVIEPARMDVLRLSVESRMATYDCEYVVLAQRLMVRLITADKKVLQRFPDVAMSIEDFAQGN